LPRALPNGGERLVMALVSPDVPGNYYGSSGISALVGNR
jgi:hypothetical protein